MYEAQTQGVVVRVTPTFLEEQSDPDNARFIWAYTVEIENHGERSVRLVARRWRITDATGRIQEVEGDGVVGEQPLLRPGECFSYTSGAPLPTPSGIMGGEYLMETDDGGAFDATIPTFSLDSPHDPHRGLPH